MMPCMIPPRVSAIRPHAYARLFATITTPSVGGTLPTPQQAVVGRSRQPKKDENIMNIFGGLEGEQRVLPERFATLKRQICGDPELMEAKWRSVLKELEKEVEVMMEARGNIIPQVAYQDVANGFTQAQVAEIKKRGAVIIRGGVPRDEALAWKQSILDYIAANRDRVKGAPPDRIVFFELYNTPAQIAARAHPALITSQKALLSLWHNSARSASASSSASLSTPISYFDRMRIRHPGPSVFTLGPHIDSGGVERWEDPGFRTCFRGILESTSPEGWKQHDAFDVAPRLNARQDLYDTPNQCTVFRPWQGWTALSSTGSREGTLQVVPMLTLSSAYIMLRPFFSRRARAPPDSLKADDWVLDLKSTDFPGSVPGKAQQLSTENHPHLRMNRTLVSIPKVEPGDQVYWHCDIVHAVEREHTGSGDSAVLYIPAVPLTEKNAQYLRDQRTNFAEGLPAPDFPEGEGESQFTGRVTVHDLENLDARRMFGLAPFQVPEGSSPGEKRLIEAANRILF